eukprot:TRINITY_DN5228_c0_g2_i1.p1 TRINITY_DN5228_c0_g2~~TRINITY_DN5228_c0_g2_i1.p1  ORF type:complete len:165 (+),score=32.89 TRINITY_DN5228_c0_g2_i1:73-567(+)
MCAGDFNETSSAAECTTYMVCNLPCRVSEERLVEALGEMGFKDSFDIVYIPKLTNRAGKVHNFGYGFVNFTSALTAATFPRVFHGYRFLEFASEKVCEVRDSHIQGKALSLYHMGKKRNGKSMSKSFVARNVKSDFTCSPDSPPEPKDIPECKFLSIPFSMKFQ